MRARALFCAAAFVATLGLGVGDVWAAGEAPRRSIAVNAFMGHAWMVRPRLVNANELDGWNGGGAASLGISFRSSYFLTPFVDVGYFPLYRSRNLVDLGSLGGKAVATNEIDGVGALAGVAIEVFRVRAAAAIGAYDLRVRSTVLGSSVSPHELSMGYMFALGGVVLRRRRFQVGAEVRARLVVETDTAAIELGLGMSGEAISF